MVFISCHVNSLRSELPKTVNKLGSDYEIESGTQIPCFLSGMQKKTAKGKRISLQYPRVDSLYLATSSHPDKKSLRENLCHAS